MKMRNARLVLALAAAWGVAAPAVAQEQPDAEAAPETVLPEVHVNVAPRLDIPSEETGSYTVRSSSSATGLDLSLRETPQSISVITQEQIDDYRLTTINDVLDNATGIVVERVETDRTYYTARGSDVSNFQLDGIGLPLNFGLATGDIDTAAYDRIEIIRGANGLASPTGNPSATVNFVRKRPTADFRAAVDVTAGSWDNYRLETDVSGMLNDAGDLRGRFVAAEQDKNSYLDRYEHEKTMLYGILEADIGDSTLLAFGHTYQKNNADSPLWGSLPLLYSNGSRIHYDTSASSSADWAFWNTRDNRTFAELAHEFSNGWQAKAVLTYRHSEEHGQMFYPWNITGIDAATGIGITPYASDYVMDNRQTLIDVFAKGPFTLAGREHELMLGTSRAKSRMRESSLINLASFGDVVSLDQMLDGSYPKPAFTDDGGNSSFEDTRSSIYAAAHFNITDRLKFIGGARTTSVKSTGENYGVQHEYETHDKVTPYAGVVYDLDARHSAYASYTGIFNPQTEIDINRQPLAPLEGKNYEVGIKSEWLNKQLNSSVALFRTKQDNVAEAAGTLPPGLTYYRGVSAVAEGLEIDVAGKVTDRLKVQGGYTAMSLEATDGEDIKTYTPRHLFNLTTTYRVPMVDKLKVGMSVKWRGDVHKDIGGARVEQESYALVDLMAAYEIDKRTTLALNIDNVTDEKYLTSLLWDQSFYGTPRSASLTLSWKY